MRIRTRTQTLNAETLILHFLAHSPHQLMLFYMKIVLLFVLFCFLFHKPDPHSLFARFILVPSVSSLFKTHMRTPIKSDTCTDTKTIKKFIICVRFNTRDETSVVSHTCVLKQNNITRHYHE